MQIFNEALSLNKDCKNDKLKNAAKFKRVDTFKNSIFFIYWCEYSYFFCRFSLDSNTGVLSSASSLAVKTYNLKVRASDRGR